MRQLSLHQAGQECGDGREKGHQDQSGGGDADKGPYLLDDPVDRPLAHLAGHEQVQAHGRGDVADGCGADHVAAQVDQGNAVLLGDGGEDGGQDHHGGGRVDEAARDQQHHQGAEDEPIAAVADGEHGVCQSGGHTLLGEDPGEGAGARHDHHDAAGGTDGAGQAGEQLLEVHLLIDEHAYDDGIGAGDGGGLRGGKHAGVDAAQDDEGREQGPDGVLEGGPGLGQAEGALALEAPLVAGVDHVDDDQGGHEQAGAGAGDQHGADGLVGGDGVEHHGDAGGDQGPEDAAGGLEGAGVIRIVAPLIHGGDHDGADGGRGSHGGAGHGSEEHAGHDDHHGTSATISD